jgi:hypothetical protein
MICSGPERTPRGDAEHRTSDKAGRSPDPPRPSRPLAARLPIAPRMLRSPSSSGKVSQVPRLTRKDQLAAPVRPRADNATLRHDRLPPAPLPPVLTVVVEDLLLRPPAELLVSKAAEALVRDLWAKLAAAVIARPRQEHETPRTTLAPPLLPPRARLRVVPLIPVTRPEDGAARTNLTDHVRIPTITNGEKSSGRGTGWVSQ